MTMNLKKKSRFTLDQALDEAASSYHVGDHTNYELGAMSEVIAELFQVPYAEVKKEILRRHEEAVLEMNEGE